jgi:hypothetical protein
MILGAAAALWGLVAIPLLVLLSFWRMRPARVVVPSVVLWRRMAANVPPVKALRRPDWSLTLLLQVLTVAACVFALAQPMHESQAPRPRRLAVVVDLGARAHLDRINEEIAGIRAATAGDDVVMFESPVLRRGRLAEVREKVDYAGDPAAAIALARQEGRRVLFIGDRPAGADVDVLVGGPSGNLGIVDFVPERDGTWVKLVNLGPERDVAVRVAGREERWRVAAGESERVFAGEPTLELLERDGFEIDNIAAARRLAVLDVELRGDAHANLRRAIEIQPGARLVDRGGAFVVSVGAGAAGPSLVVAPPRGGTFTPREMSLAGDPLLRGTTAEHWRLSDVADLAECEPLVFADGRAVVGRRGDSIVINGALHEFALTPSFPIFISNVLESRRSGRGEWVVRRTCAAEPRVGAGAFVLDAAVSRLGGDRRPFRAEDAGEAPFGPVRTEWSAWIAAAALALAVAAWASEQRGSR